MFTQNKPVEFEIRKVEIPESASKYKGVLAAHIYPLAQLVIGGDAIVVKNRTYISITNAVRAFMADNEGFFLVRKVGTHVVIWRVANDSLSGVVKKRANPKMKPSITPSTAAPKSLDKQLIPVTPVLPEAILSSKRKYVRKNNASLVTVMVDEVYPVAVQSPVYELTPSGKRKPSTLTELEITEICNLANSNTITRISVASMFNLWPADISIIAQRESQKNKQLA